MAEIRVERKQGAGKWLWIVLLLIVVLAILAYLWYAGYFGGTSATDTTQVLLEESWRAIMTA